MSLPRIGGGPSPKGHDSRGVGCKVGCLGVSVCPLIQEQLKGHMGLFLDPKSRSRGVSGRSLA